MLQSSIAKGGAAGLVASVAQAALGKAEDALLLPSWEDSHIAPRLVDRLAESAGWEVTEATEWAAGTAFHLGYGALWGMAYAAVHRRHPVVPVFGGLLLGGVIYGITFPRWGGAVRTGTERPPEARTRRMTFVAACVTTLFGLTTAVVYDRLTFSDRARDADQVRTPR